MMSFKRNNFDDDNDEGSGGDSQPFQKRQRFEDNGGRGGRGRGRGRGDGFRGSRDGGFRGRGGGFRGGDRFNRDSRGGGGFRGRGDRGRGGYRFDDERGRGRGRGGGRGGGRDFGDRRGGFGGGGGYNRPYNNNDSIIKVGQDAPNFQNILNEKSENVSLQQFRGKYLVLFIYFRDSTYGCSTEQKAFRDLKQQFDKYNATILGVSRDDEQTHKDAIAESNLNFSLLADTDSKIIKSYGALDETDRVNRCTFIISPEGKVAAVWGRVFGFDKHPQEVLDKLKEVSSGSGNSTLKKASNDNDDEEHSDNNDDDNDNDNDNDNANGNDDDGDDDNDDDE